MGATASLTSKSVRVEPGASGSIEIKVRNTGQVVDQFNLDVVGDAATWARVEPPTLSLFPGAEGTAQVIFSPPRQSTIPAGPMPVGVRVRSQEDPAGSVVEEGVVEVNAFTDTFAELLPRTSRGRRGSRHDLAIDNRGNVRLNSEVSAGDPDQLLNFSVQPPAVVADPGTASFARVQVKPKRRFWRGQPKTRPFKVFVQPGTGAPLTVDGTMLQEAILPSWFVPAIIGLIALAIAAAVLWLTLLKPTIESAAGQKAEEVLASVGITPPPPGTTPAPVTPAPTGPATPAPTGAPTPAPTAGGGTPAPTPAGSTPAAGTPGPTGGGTGTTIGIPGDLVAGRLFVGNLELRLTDKETFYLTDLVFSNPNADTGFALLRRNDEILFREKLENFRSLDYHFDTPIVLKPGEVLRFEPQCTAACDPSVTYSGFMQRAP